MRATGIIRRIDDLGRVVIPKEIRRAMRIREGDPLEIYTTKEGVCFRKYSFINEHALTASVSAVKALARWGVLAEVYNMDGEPIGEGAKWQWRDEWLNDNIPRDGLQTIAIKADGEQIGVLVYRKDNNKLASSLAGSMASMIGFSVE